MEQDSTPEGETPEVVAETSETTTQVKTFDADYVKQLRAEAARYRKEAQEAKAKASEFEDRDKSELEKLTGKLSKAEQEKADAEARLLRYEVATEKQISGDALDLLTGNTREELEAKADKLLELTNNAQATPEFDGGPRDPAPEAKTPEQAHNELAVALFGVPPQ